MTGIGCSCVCRTATRVVQDDIGREIGVAARRAAEFLVTFDAAPGRILRRHPDDQHAQVGVQAHRTAATRPIRPLSCDQLAMPAQDRIRRHECRHLQEQAAAKSMSQQREASALAVVESEPPAREPNPQNAILFPQERDDVGLLTMEPATQGRDQQLERGHGRSPRHGRRSTCGHYGVRSGPRQLVASELAATLLQLLTPCAKAQKSRLIGRKS